MARLVARLGLATFFLIVFVAVTIAVANGSWSIETALQLTAFASFAVVGALLVEQTGNRVGWICLAIAIGGGITGGTEEFIRFAYDHPGTPGVGIAAVLEVLVGFPAAGLAFTFLPLLFPDGRLPSRRWTPVAWLAAVDLGLLIVAFGLTQSGRFGSGPSPLAIIPQGPTTDQLVAFTGLVTIVTGSLCASALLVRYRRASGDERQQLKWVAAAVGLFAASLVVSVLLPPLDLFAWVLPILPISVGIAVLRYRLYDIDLIISRALVYIPLTGLLGGLYAASVALFQRFFVLLTGDRSDAAVIITTLILAGVFTPARKSLEGAVDRRFKPVGGIAAQGLEAAPADAGPALDPAAAQEVEAIARRVFEERLAERSDGLAGRGGPGYHLDTSIPVEEARRHGQEGQGSQEAQAGQGEGPSRQVGP